MPFLSGERFVMIDDFLIDVALSEEHEFEAEVTEFPVESGATISDNIRPKPIAVTIEGLVSGTPLSAITAARPGRSTVLDEDISIGVNPMKDAYQILVAIRDKRESVTIRTSLDTYTNMALESLSIPRDAATGEALKFTARFRQIVTVINKRSKRVAIPKGKGKTMLGQLASKLKGLLGIPVASFPVAQRKEKTKQLGKPILTTVEGVPKGTPGVHQAANGIRLKDGYGQLDHYQLTEKLLKKWSLDGYVGRNVYYRLNNNNTPAASFAGATAYADNFTKVPPSFEAWPKLTAPTQELPGDTWK